VSAERDIVRGILTKFGLTARHTLGQNFFLQPELLEPFVAERLSGTELVVEVGPGLGFLTQLLLPRARHVIAVEIDPRVTGVPSTKGAL